MGGSFRLLETIEASRVFTYLLVEPFLPLFLYNNLGLSFFVVGLVITATTVPALAAALWGGLLTDRLGRHRMVAASTALEAIGFATLAIAFFMRNLWVVLLSYATISVATSLGQPAVSSYVADSFQGSKRTQAFSGLRIADNAGSGAGVAAGGFLIGAWGFVETAVLGTAILVGAAVLTLTLLPRTAYDKELDLGSEEQSLKQNRRHPRSPLKSLAIVRRDSTFLLTAAGFLCIGFYQAYYPTALPLYSREFLGMSYSLLGIGLALNSVLVVLTQNFTTSLRLGRSLTGTAIIGTGFYAASFLVLGAAGEWKLSPIILFYVAMVVLTIGENLVEIPKRTLPSNLAPRSEIGMYNGTFRAMFQTGQAISPVGVGLGFALFSRPVELWMFLLIPAIPAVILLSQVKARIGMDEDSA